MAIVRKTISLTEEQDAWVKAQVASGRFASDSEVYRALITEMMELERKESVLLEHIKAGQDSGYSDATFEEIIAKGRKRAEDVLASRRKGAA